MGVAGGLEISGPFNGIFRPPLYGDSDVFVTIPRKPNGTRYEPLSHLLRMMDESLS